MLPDAPNVVAKKLVATFEFFYFLLWKLYFPPLESKKFERCITALRM
jgi:hypothetical protein